MNFAWLALGFVDPSGVPWGAGTDIGRQGIKQLGKSGAEELGEVVGRRGLREVEERAAREVGEDAWRGMAGGLDDFVGIEARVGPTATGQLHHAVSAKVHQQLEQGKNLKGLYRYRDPRLATRAKDAMSHCGYEDWHRNLDDEVVGWISRHADATQNDFEAYLRNRYRQPDLLGRFPGGL